MLVLSRKASEKIVIGGEIEITVLRIAGGRIQLGIAAPRDFAIKRGELLALTSGPDSSFNKYALAAQ